MDKNFEDLRTEEIAAMSDDELREFSGPEWDIDDLRDARERCREIIRNLLP